MKNLGLVVGEDPDDGWRWMNVMALGHPIAMDIAKAVACL